MKKILSILALSALLFSACEGDLGIPGPQGPQGNDGGLIVSSAFEIVVDFNQSNDFQFIEPYGFQVFPSDVTLVYLLWDTINGQDVWRLLPQTVQFEDGSLIYNFDFTQQDVAFFLEGTTDLTTLEDVWTQNQVFRVVVVPADNIDGVDISNIENVLSLESINSLELRD